MLSSRRVAFAAFLVTFLTACSDGVSNQRSAPNSGAEAPNTVANWVAKNLELPVPVQRKYQAAQNAIKRALKGTIYCGNSVCKTNAQKKRGFFPGTFVCQQFGYYGAAAVNKARLPGVSATAFAFYFGSSNVPIGNAHAITRIAIRHGGKVYVFYLEPQPPGGEYAVIALSESNVETSEQMADVGRQFYSKYLPFIFNDVMMFANNSAACEQTNKSGGLWFSFERNYYPDSWRALASLGQQCPATIPAPPALSSRTIDKVKTGIMLSCAPPLPPVEPIDDGPSPPPPLKPVPLIPVEVAVTNAVTAPCGPAIAPHVQCSLHPLDHLVHRDAGQLGTEEARRDLAPGTGIECSIDGFDAAKHRVSLDVAGVEVTEFPTTGRYRFVLDGSATPAKVKVTVATSCQVPTPPKGSLSVEIKVSKNYGPVYTDRSAGYVASSPVGISCGNGQNHCQMACGSGETNIKLGAAEVIGRGKFMGFIDRATGASLCMGSAVCTIQCSDKPHGVDALYIEDLIMPGPTPRNL